MTKQSPNPQVLVGLKLLPAQINSEETSFVMKDVYNRMSPDNGYVCAREGKTPELSSLSLEQFCDHTGAQPSSDL